MHFNVGDTVQLKSGGPAMTISIVFVEDQEAECKWFDRSSIKRDKFNFAMLKESNGELTLEELVCGSRNEKTHLGEMVWCVVSTTFARTSAIQEESKLRRALPGPNRERPGLHPTG